MTRNPDRRQRQAAAVREFVRRYARPSGRGGADPNDRHYDRAFQLRARRMRPADLDALLRDGEDDAS